MGAVGIRPAKLDISEGTADSEKRGLQKYSNIQAARLCNFNICQQYNYNLLVSCLFVECSKY